MKEIGGEPVNEMPKFRADKRRIAQYMQQRPGLDVSVRQILRDLYPDQHPTSMSLKIKELLYGAKPRGGDREPMPPMPGLTLVQGPPGKDAVLRWEAPAPRRAAFDTPPRPLVVDALALRDALWALREEVSEQTKVLNRFVDWMEGK